MRVNRARRYGAARLPLRASPPLIHRVTATVNAISCWYCDLKIYALNEPLFRFGRKHTMVLKLWFSIGTGFGLTALIGVTWILIWQLFLSSDTRLSNLFSSLLFGLSPSLRISMSDAGYLFISTLVSVSVHEFGHAIALASEGIQLEYIAVFIAVLFPGALVAFDYDLLQALPRLTSLRVYCAGLSVVAGFAEHFGLSDHVLCTLWVFVVPAAHDPVSILHACREPFGTALQILEVASPLSEFLSPGDAIVSLDGAAIHSVQDWMEMTALLDKKILQNSSDSRYFKGFGAVDSRKGYCVPNALLEDGKNVQLAKNRSVCPEGFTAFMKIYCFDPSKSVDMDGEDVDLGRKENALCLNTKDIVNLEKCDGRGKVKKNGSSCMCSEDESCLSPVQFPDLMWIEITYSRLYSRECLQLRSSLLDSNTSSDAQEQTCGGTFIFVGDMISMAHSVQLTEYQPRWGVFLSKYLPNKLEKSLICTFHVSLALALLNSLPIIDDKGIFPRRGIDFGGGIVPLHIIELKKNKKNPSSMCCGREFGFSSGLLEDDVYQFLLVLLSFRRSEVKRKKERM
ncbi:membrane-bound transcription factor site-2 protease-like protein [Gossypium australe]|uniref:Membrane-bound transcription factor site-2 protease-like protein n=1 Tax=Gossypium australe TaxID=47621 RepID=A0A5B6X2U7_9ROSI|nr:membrane-bound transcription factor site-2 protease-like protein [Gossypium australe]